MSKDPGAVDSWSLGTVEWLVWVVSPSSLVLSLLGLVAAAGSVGCAAALGLCEPHAGELVGEGGGAGRGLRLGPAFRKVGGRRGAEGEGALAGAAQGGAGVAAKVGGALAGVARAVRQRLQLHAAPARGGAAGVRERGHEGAAGTVLALAADGHAVGSCRRRGALAHGAALGCGVWGLHAAHGLEGGEARDAA